MKARTLIFFSFLCIFYRIEAHPIHVSVVSLDHLIDSNRIDISVRLFYDDFQLLINHKYNLGLDFSKRTRLTSTEQLAITDYIRTSLILAGQDENTISADFKGWKVEDVSVWLYFCAKTAPGFILTKLKNTLMLDLYYDQKNLVIVQVNNNQMGFEFDKRVTSQIMSL